MKASDFKYCPICQMERSPNSLISKIDKKIIIVCTNKYTAGDLDPYEYEKRIQTINKKLCPICNNCLEENKWVDPDDKIDKNVTLEDIIKYYN